MKTRLPRTYEEREDFMRDHAIAFAQALKVATRGMIEADREAHALTGLSFLFEEMLQIGMRISETSLQLAVFWPLRQKRIIESRQARNDLSAAGRDMLRGQDNVVTRSKVITSA